MRIARASQSIATPPKVLPALGLRSATKNAAPIPVSETGSLLLRSALQSATQAARAPSPALRSAVSKLQRAAQLFCGDSLVDALGQLLLEQSRHTAQRCDLAKNAIDGNFRELERQNIKEMKLIQERIENARSSGVFDVIGKIFKAIAAAFTATAGALSGNALLLAGAGLLVTSFVSSCAGGSFGCALGLVSGIAGSLCTVGGTLWSPSIPGLSAAARLLEGTESTAKLVTSFGAATAASGAGGAALAKGICDGEVLRADAALLETRRRAEHLHKETADERELMGALREAEDRGLRLLLRALDSNERAACVANRGGNR